MTIDETMRDERTRDERTRGERTREPKPEASCPPRFVRTALRRRLISMSSELVVAVAAIKADGKRTSPEDVLAQLQAADPRWATVTMSQVRRAITAANAAASPLDGDSKAEQRKANERARDQKRDRSGRERIEDTVARVQRRHDAKADACQAIDDSDIAALEYELSQSTLRLSMLHILEKQDGWHDTSVHGITCAPSGELLLSCQCDPWMWSLVRPSKRSSVCGDRTPKHFILSHVLGRAIEW